jgi:hypothetical protein
MVKRRVPQLRIWCNIALQAVVGLGLKPYPFLKIPEVTNLRVQHDTIICYKPHSSNQSYYYLSSLLVDAYYF